MLKSKLGKKLAASATALAMVASAAASSISTLTAYAGVVTGEGAFEDGVGLPWHICENGTAVMQFSIDREDGVYSIFIENPGGVDNGGVSRWDCQFRHRNLTIVNGHTYRITYSVYATKAGHLFAKLGDVTNDDCEYWHENGQELSMEYKPHTTLSELETTLKAASPGGKMTSYGEGWENWKSIDIKEKTWQTFAWEFTYNSSDIQNTTPPDGKGTVEWTFHFGGDGEYSLPGGLFPAGTMIKFDNLMLIDMTGTDGDYVPDSAKPKTGLVLNQLGYFPNLNKVATIEVDSASASPVEFKVVSSSGTVAYSGKGSATKKDEGSWEYCQTLDFSDLKDPGTYHIEANGVKSADFEIGDKIYGDLLGDALNYYYLNRSGTPIEEKYVRNSGKNSSKAALARAAGHPKDMAYVTDEWVMQYTEQTNAEITARYSKQVDLSKGWYDAGDYGKYVVNGGVSMWTLANIYERTMVHGSKDKFADGSGVANIPESGNGTPDILDELCWEADFFLNMQREDGMVYHKMHDYKWTGLGVMPFDDTDVPDTNMPTRIVKPVTYAATLNTAAALGQLARLLEDYDSAAASKYLAAAEKAYSAAKTKYSGKYGSIYGDPGTDATALEVGSEPSPFAPLDQNKGGGPYGDTQVTDEFYWAACELYITTGKDEYYNDLKDYKEAFTVTTNLVGGENKGSPTSFTWGTLASLGTASLALNPDVITETELKTVENSFQAAGDTYLKYEGESMYGTPYPGHTYSTKVTDFIGDTTSERDVELTGGYEWGSNSMVINNAMILGMAYDVTNDVKYLNGVTTAMDYILGRNAMENSYVTGYGSSTTENPHHRYWCHQLKNDWPFAPNGCLSGGPNSDMNDPMIKGAGYQIGELAPMKCYYDQVDAWSVNEITINWNAPLVWIASFVEDEAPKAGESQPDKPTEANPGTKKYGDANEDGSVDLVDVVLVNKNLMIGTEMSAQGKENADVDDNGTMDEVDSLNILKYIIQLVDFPVK